MNRARGAAPTTSSGEPQTDDPLPSAARASAVLELFPALDAPPARFRRAPAAAVPPSVRSLRFLQRAFPGATLDQWNDWRWQIRHSVTSLDQLSSILDLSADEREAFAIGGGALPLRITPYYAGLLDAARAEHPLRKAVVPVTAESCSGPGEAVDPLGEDGDSPVPGLVHRYPDRVLFLTTAFCASYCRYCTRSRLVGDRDEQGPGSWERALDYIRAHTEIRDVLLSGGDPLTLDDETLAGLLGELRRIPHVEILRLGTKVPMVLPQRITPALTRMLSRFHPLYVNVHCTHPDELTPESRRAFAQLADAGIPLGSQTVLLAGINDSVETMRELYRGLLSCRVRPYYLYQCDPILGSAHFRTPVAKGLEIIEGLRGHLSGLAVPHYVIDAPGGGGKIPLLPGYVAGRDDGGLTLRNYEGRTFRYPDPAG